MVPLAPRLFLFSVLTTFKICAGAHKEMPPVHFPSVAPTPAKPQDPPTHLHVNGAMQLLRSQIYRSVIPFLWFHLKVEIHSEQRMEGSS